MPASAEGEVANEELRASVLRLLLRVRRRCVHEGLRRVEPLLLLLLLLLLVWVVLLTLLCEGLRGRVARGEWRASEVVGRRVRAIGEGCRGDLCEVDRVRVVVLVWERVGVLARIWLLHRQSGGCRDARR